MNNCATAVLSASFVTVCSWLVHAGQPVPVHDQRALSAVVERWTEARNANDAEAMRPLFAKTVDRVSPPQGDVKSTTRDELLQFFAKDFSGTAKGT